MGAGKTATQHHKKMIEDLTRIIKHQGLKVSTGVPMGKSILGTERTVDLVVTQEVGGGMVYRRLGIDCVYQEGSGTAKWKVFGKVEDTKRWPFKGIIVYAGPGLGSGTEAVLSYLGAVHITDVTSYILAYFDLPGIGGTEV